MKNPSLRTLRRRARKLLLDAAARAENPDDVHAPGVPRSAIINLRKERLAIVFEIFKEHGLVGRNELLTEIYAEAKTRASLRQTKTADF
jgi:hypothetical protein